MKTETLYTVFIRRLGRWNIAGQGVTLLAAKQHVKELTYLGRVSRYEEADAALYATL